MKKKKKTKDPKVKNMFKYIKWYDVEEHEHRECIYPSP